MKIIMILNNFFNIKFKNNLDIFLQKKDIKKIFRNLKAIFSQYIYQRYINFNLQNIQLILK